MKLEQKDGSLCEPSKKIDKESMSLKKEKLKQQTCQNSVCVNNVKLAF